MTTTKKGRKTFFGEEKCTRRENPGSAYKKRAPHYVGMGP